MLSIAGLILGEEIAIQRFKMPKFTDFNNRTRSGINWIIVSSGAGQAIRLVSNIALAALLYEEAFALMALVAAVMMGLAMFSDIGIEQSVIQSSKGDDPEFLNTAWTLQVIRGVLLTIAGIILAWPISQFYSSNDAAARDLIWLIPIVSLTATIDGLRSPRALTASRMMALDKLSKIEILVVVVNAAVMICLAWFTKSVYALAASAVISSAVHTTLTYLWLPGPRVRVGLNKEAIGSIVAFGKWIFVATILSFFAVQMDRLAFAAIFPLADVGVYSIAASLTLTVTSLVGRLQSSIMFPWYSRIIENETAIPEAFKKSAPPVLILSTYLCSLLIVGAENFFALAYDNRYSLASEYVPILAIGVWLSSIGGIYGSVFLALGHSQWVAIVSAVKVTSFLTLLFFGSLFDLTLTESVGLVVASEIITVSVSRYLGWKIGIHQIWMESKMFALLATSAVLGHWASCFMAQYSLFYPAVQLFCLGAITTLIFLPIAAPLLKSHFQRYNKAADSGAV